MRNVFHMTCLVALALVVLRASPSLGHVPDLAPQASIDRISFSERSDGQGVVVRFHSGAKIDAFSEARSAATGGFELILFNASLAPSYRRDAPAAPVTGYQVEEQDGHLRVVLSVEPGTPAPGIYRDNGSFDILIGLRLPPGPPTDMSQAANRWSLDTIVIDAGHGGKDTGAVGYRGLREKDIVLNVAHKLGAYLEELLGVTVVYTREDDRFIELHQRGHIANEAGAKLFISIHANASPNRSAQGTETFFVGMHKTDAARKVMERENEVIKFEDDQQVYEAWSGAQMVQHALTQSAYMRHSEALAGHIQTQFTDRVGRKNRGVKQAGFYVLWSASMPAVLVELGFITNADEARFMASDEGQSYLASAIFRSVRDFKSSYEKGLHVSASGQ